MITQIFPENLQELDWEHGDFKENVKKLEEYIRYMRERIEYNGGQNSKRISLVVSDENGGKLNEAQIVAAINEGESEINLKANRVSIDSDNFELSRDGAVTAKAINIKGGTIDIETDYDPNSKLVLKWASELSSQTKEVRITPEKITVSNIDTGNLPYTVEITPFSVKVSEDTTTKCIVSYEGIYVYEYGVLKSYFNKTGAHVV